jgi:hypothetical protein
MALNSFPKPLITLHNLPCNVLHIISHTTNTLSKLLILGYLLQDFRFLGFPWIFVGVFAVEFFLEALIKSEMPIRQLVPYGFQGKA